MYNEDYEDEYDDEEFYEDPDFSEEVWATIAEAPRYAVSNYGRVINRATGRILKTDAGQYANVRLSKGNGTQLATSVHVLVAEAFVGPRPFGFTVNHKDLNKRNNYYENLEWMSQSENNRHSNENGGIKNQWDYGNTRTVQVLVVETNQIFGSIKECAKQLSIHEQSITNVLHGRSRTGGGYTFKRV